MYTLYQFSSADYKFHRILSAFHLQDVLLIAFLENTGLLLGSLKILDGKRNKLSPSFVCEWYDANRSFCADFWPYKAIERIEFYIDYFNKNLLTDGG